MPYTYLIKARYYFEPEEKDCDTQCIVAASNITEAISIFTNELNCTITDLTVTLYEYEPVVWLEPEEYDRRKAEVTESDNDPNF